MDNVRDELANRAVPGIRCSMGLLMDNVTPEDHKTITDAMALIFEHRKSGRESNKPPNAAWLTRLIREHMDINLPREVVSRHMRRDCKCHK